MYTYYSIKINLSKMLEKFWKFDDVLLVEWKKHHWIKCNIGQNNPCIPNIVY